MRTSDSSGGIEAMRFDQWRIYHWAMAPLLKIYFSFFAILRNHGLYIFELFDILNWQRESGRNIDINMIIASMVATGLHVYLFIIWC